MKKLLILSGLLLAQIFTQAQDACTHDSQAMQPLYGTGSPFSLSGKVAAHEGKTLTLYRVENQQLVPLDSTQVKNGAFALSGKINVPMPAVLVLNDSSSLPLVLEPVSMELSVNAECFENSEVKGADANRAFAEAYRQMAVYRARLKELDERYQRYFMLGVHNQQLYAQLNAEQAKVNAEQTEAAKNFVKQHPKALASAAVMAGYLGNLPPEELELLYNSLDACIRAQPTLSPINARLNAERVTGIGTTFRDIALPTPAGDTLRLSAYAGKGKYTLLLFWASWCGYCQQEIPLVVDIYNQLKDRGFDIFAVSGDTDKAAWTAKVEEAKMTFANVSDLQGFNSEAFKLYYVQGIPYMVLLDKEGKIIAKGSLNQGVKAKIDEIFGEEAK